MSDTHRILDPALPRQIRASLCALAIMTKAPRAGEVKTRLAPPLTSEEAATLNACFLRDTAATISNVTRTGKAIGVGVYTPVGAEGTYQGILPENFWLLPQRGNSFGERLTFAIQDLLDTGFGAVCLIDSDSPTVPQNVFAEAVETLSQAGDRVVLGPSEDGGYYLIGLKKLHRRLFQGIDWSSEKVFKQTIARAREIELQIHCLPTSFDVDDRTGLRRLCQELFNDVEDPSLRHTASATHTYLASIIKNEGPARLLG